MWRYFAMAGAALLLALAGVFLFRSSSVSALKLPGAPAARAAAVAAGEEEPLPAEAPRASDRTREEKRFDRYDKDRNDAITREEYLLARRKAWAKLDANRDGKLDFEEWAAKTTTKFAGADADKSGALSRAEFVATKPKVKPGARPRCACPAAPAKEETAED